MTDPTLAGERVERVRSRWDGLGPWRQTADTPWGTKVVHADFGEAFVGTTFHATKPTEAWKATARESAEERRRLMCKVASAVASAPDDIAVLLAEIDRLRADLGALYGRSATMPT